MRHLLASVLALGLVAAAAPALAQSNPTFTYGTKDDAAAAEAVKDTAWEVSAQAGLMVTTGNSRSTTFTAGAAATRKANKNKFAFEVGAAYARSSIFIAQDLDASGTIDSDAELTRQSFVSTESWVTKGRYDRFLTLNNALYAAAGLSADPPAGKELVGNGQVGYSRQLIADAVNTVVAEAGYDLAYEDLTVGDGVTIHSLRVFAGYEGKLDVETVLSSSIEALFNLNPLTTAAGEVDAFEDNRVTGKLALTTKLTGRIRFRLGFEARFDNAPAPRPPVPGIPYGMGFVPLADELDTRTEATFVLSLL